MTTINIAELWKQRVQPLSELKAMDLDDILSAETPYFGIFKTESADDPSGMTLDLAELDANRDQFEADLASLSATEYIDITNAMRALSNIANNLSGGNSHDFVTGHEFGTWELNNLGEEASWGAWDTIFPSLENTWAYYFIWIDPNGLSAFAPYPGVIRIWSLIRDNLPIPLTLEPDDNHKFFYGRPGPSGLSPAC